MALGIPDCPRHLCRACTGTKSHAPRTSRPLCGACRVPGGEQHGRVRCACSLAGRECTVPVERHSPAGGFRSVRLRHRRGGGHGFSGSSGKTKFLNMAAAPVKRAPVWVPFMRPVYAPARPRCNSQPAPISHALITRNPLSSLRIPVSLGHERSKTLVSGSYCAVGPTSVTVAKGVFGRRFRANSVASQSSFELAPHEIR